MLAGCKVEGEGQMARIGGHFVSDLARRIAFDWLDTDTDETRLQRALEPWVA